MLVMEAGLPSLSAGDGAQLSTSSGAGRVRVQHEGLLQQLQTSATAEVPLQPPILTCSLLPQRHPRELRWLLGQV